MLARRRLSSRIAPVSKRAPQTRQACCSRETCDLSFMTILRLHGRNCPEPSPARRSASRQGSRTATAASVLARAALDDENRSEEHTSELQSLMRISYAVFCLTKKTKQLNTTTNRQQIRR